MTEVAVAEEMIGVYQLGTWHFEHSASFSL